MHPGGLRSGAAVLIRRVALRRTNTNERCAPLRSRCTKDEPTAGKRLGQLERGAEGAAGAGRRNGSRGAAANEPQRDGLGRPEIDPANDNLRSLREQLELRFPGAGRCRNHHQRHQGTNRQEPSHAQKYGGEAADVTASPRNIRLGFRLRQSEAVGTTPVRRRIDDAIGGLLAAGERQPVDRHGR